MHKPDLTKYFNASQEFFASYPLTVEEAHTTLESIAKKRGLPVGALEYYIDCIAFESPASREINESIEKIITIKETLNELTNA